MAAYSVWKHYYDDEWIVENWSGRCTKDFHAKYVEETGHDVCQSSLRHHIYRVLGLQNDYYYTDDEISFVKENYGKLGAKECARRLGVNLIKVYSIAHDRLGIKMTKEEFKKHVPVYEAKHPVGAIVQNKDGNYTIKAEDGWHELGRYVWEKHHGKIPDDYYVVFLNRDPRDARIENLAIVPRGVVGAFNCNDMWHDDPELNKTHILVMLLERAMKGVVE